VGKRNFVSIPIYWLVNSGKLEIIPRVIVAIAVSYSIPLSVQLSLTDIAGNLSGPNSVIRLQYSKSRNTKADKTKSGTIFIQKLLIVSKDKPCRIFGNFWRRKAVERLAG
jgi:hypothetical protein